MKKVNIGLIGFGTVGSGVYNLLKTNSEIISERMGMQISIKTICELRLDYVKSQVTGVNLISDWRDLIADPEIDTIIELIGGIEPAKTIIMEALKNGKNVVTANKKLIAEAGEDIISLANSGKARFGFEASVCGGIPCLLSLKKGLVGNKILSVMGILNGTTNYILTKMERENLSFDSALKEAQKSGFAEADPTFDIEGFDAGHKITILSMLAFNKKVDYKTISIEGITKISTLDIAFAGEMGYVIKLLGIAKQNGNELDVRVHPTMIEKDHQLAAVHNEFNGVLFVGDMTGQVSFYGKGAGSSPTASAVISDVVQIAQLSDTSDNAIAINGDAVILPAEKRFSRYYIRMHTKDTYGILEKIAGVFAQNEISISSLVQKEGTGDVVPLIFITHECNEKNMLKAIDKINSFDFMQEKLMMIRIEK